MIREAREAVLEHDYQTALELYLQAGLPRDELETLRRQICHADSYPYVGELSLTAAMIAREHGLQQQGSEVVSEAARRARNYWGSDTVHGPKSSFAATMARSLEELAERLAGESGGG